MEDIYKSLENIGIHDYKIGKTYVVVVTFINSPHSFYIRPTCTNLKILEEPGQPVQSFNLSLGSTVVYKSQISNKFVRGNIFGINKPDTRTFDIFAVDYGYFDKSVDINVIFKSKTLMDVPPLVRHCRLANCEPYGTTFTNDETQVMKAYIRNDYCLMLVQAFQGDQMIVKLQNSCPNDITTMLVLTNFTHFGVDMDKSVSRIKSIPPYMAKFSLKCLNVNDVLYIRILRAKSVIPKTHYVASVDDFKMYVKNYKCFTDYCEYQRVLTKESLEVGQPVAFKPQFKNNYERAVIKSILETGYKALIFLIDIGEMKEAVLHQMKEIQCLQYFETPGIAFQCTFEEIVGAEKISENIIPGYETWIKIKEIGDPNIAEIVSRADNSQ